MSDRFVRHFVRDIRKHGCSICRHARLRFRGHTYSLCDEHLADAREKWRLLRDARRARGECINCPIERPRRARPGELRCARHAAHNRARIEAWLEVHRQEHYGRRAKTLAKLRAEGKCRYCRPHAPISPRSTVACENCLLRFRAAERRRRSAMRTAKR